MAQCRVCREQNPVNARFCAYCANPLTPGDDRRIVTIMFVDISGSTQMAEKLDSEKFRQVLAAYRDVVRQAVSRHDGTVEKFIGDAVCAVFGVPDLHEDDSLRAVRAAIDIQGEIQDLSTDLQRRWNTPLRIKIGINTGEVTVADGWPVGDANNVAARLESAAAPGEILIGDYTYRLVRHSVTVETIPPLVVAGKSKPVQAHRLLGLVDLGRGVRPTLSMTAPMVGRNRERRRLQDAFEAAVAERVCHLFTILGPGGIGKSRLVREFCDSVAGRATVLSGRCLSYGEGIVYWPLAEMVRQATGMSADESAPEGKQRLRDLLDELGVSDAGEVVAALAPLVGLGGADTGTQESFWAVRTFFQALAERRPLVLCFDDLHWAEPTLLELIEHIADWSRDAPILLLCMTRPELLEIEDRRHWGGGKLNATSMLLAPLTDERCHRLIELLMDSDDLDQALVDRITSSAAGNPLFVEQMIAALVDEGRLRREGTGWISIGNVRDAYVPPSIKALLSARLGRLNPGERRVIERAAVVGTRFYLDAVQELSEPEDRPLVGAHCMALVRKELVHPDRSDLPGVVAFRFPQVMLRDCAYEATPKQKRADLHERFARWLQARMIGGPGEHDELVGYHLEQAYHYRDDFEHDEKTIELGRQAASCLIEAADRVRQGDETGAAKLLKRAVLLLPDADPLRLRAEIDLGLALYSFGRFPDAERLLRQATERARRTSQDGLRAHARLAHLRVLFATEPDGLVATTLEEAGIALADFTRDRDEAGAAIACRSQAGAYIAAGQFAAAAKALEMAVLHAEESGVPRDAQSMRRDLAGMLSLLPQPVHESIAQTNEMLARAGEDRSLRRALLGQLAVLTAMTGDLDAAHTHLSDAEDISWDMAVPRFDPLHSGFAVARVAVLAGDLATAERELRRSYRRLKVIGERAHLATRAAALSQVMLAQNRIEDAGKYVTRCREASATDQLPAQAGWCGVHARLLARDGRTDPAIHFANNAVDLSGRTDDLDGQATALLARAEVLHHLGHKDESAENLNDALAIYVRWGNKRGVELAQQWFDGLTSGA